jgi:DNA-3-methyladenine glycosylase I
MRLLSSTGVIREVASSLRKERPRRQRCAELRDKHVNEEHCVAVVDEECGGGALDGARFACPCLDARRRGRVTSPGLSILAVTISRVRFVDRYASARQIAARIVSPPPPGGRMLRRSQMKEAALAKKKRCAWSGTDPLYVAYHDEEWGVPMHDDRVLFEFLVLEGAQAGLSWSTILRKRDAYRRAFDRFDPRKVARYDKRKVAALLADAGIVRNRAKIESAIKNARAFLDVQAEFGSFDAYQWRFVDGRPIQNRWRAVGNIPPRTAQSDAMSKDLKSRGFSFVGSTILYAHMQAVGMVNDHVVDCFRHREVAKLGRG